ncbi:hypothetical protein D915_007449 [Fasciola hepatica]|uniref:Uncharacterized protein n=1 Tax=Fasciola hepatica TaxID=6192 RepID=A0A4E0RJ78_FASHE|nr:hypothetical protein D915_007449 [Fasciola hepatica]
MKTCSAFACLQINEIEERHRLQIQCQSSDPDGEIRIPCSDEDNQTTPIPSNHEEVHRPTWEVDVRSQQMFYCKIFVELQVFSSLTNMACLFHWITLILFCIFSVKLLKKTVSESMILENNGSTWSEMFLLCTILPSLSLFFQ